MPSRRDLLIGSLGALTSVSLGSLLTANALRNASAAPVDDPAPYPANELGRVLILEYHRVQGTESAYQRSIANFTQDLNQLYAAGYRTVSLADVLAARIDLPTGTSPVVLTFDDSWASQLTLTADGLAHPASAVGLLESFASAHPDFGTHAVFYVIWNQLFGLSGNQAVQRLRWLVDHGYELGNHTVAHPNLATLSADNVQRQLGQMQSLVRHALDGYEMQTIALPYGSWPRDHTLAAGGSWNGERYQFDAVLLAWGEPAPSPFATTFNPLALPRVVAGDQRLPYWLNWLAQRAGAQYLSDGDPASVTFPNALGKFLSPAVAGRMNVSAY